MREEPFIGGNFSDATRVGDTVRRRSGPWTPAVHALLRFLERAGFEAPRTRGIDDQRREILGYVEGDAHTGWPDPAPEWLMDDEHLIQGAELLRRYHDTVAAFIPPRDAAWRFVAPGPHDIICHNDWAPWNAVFRDRHLAVMLDWDNAGPGTRLWDLANSAYSWVPLYARSAADLEPTERARRLRLYCDAYGLVDRTGVLPMIRERLLFGAGFIELEAGRGDPGFQKLFGWNVPARLRQNVADLAEDRDLYESALI
jgi:hypothetical protein